MDTLGDSYILISQDFGMIPKIQKVGQVTNWDYTEILRGKIVS